MHPRVPYNRVAFLRRIFYQLLAITAPRFIDVGEASKMVESFFVRIELVISLWTVTLVGSENSGERIQLGPPLH